MNKVIVSSMLLALGAISGCAHDSTEIAAGYSSPLKYKGLNCEQLEYEAIRISKKANQLAGHIDKNATGDDVAMGVGLVLFWPALFFIDGDGVETTEYAALKGDMEALETARLHNNCLITFHSNEYDKKPVDNSTNPVFNDSQEIQPEKKSTKFTVQKHRGTKGSTTDSTIEASYLSSADMQVRGLNPDGRLNYTRTYYDEKGNVIKTEKFVNGVRQ